MTPLHKVQTQANVTTVREYRMVVYEDKERPGPVLSAGSLSGLPLGNFHFSTLTICVLSVLC